MVRIGKFTIGEDDLLVEVHGRLVPNRLSPNEDVGVAEQGLWESERDGGIGALVLSEIQKVSFEE